MQVEDLSYWPKSLPERRWTNTMPSYPSENSFCWDLGSPRGV